MIAGLLLVSLHASADVEIRSDKDNVALRLPGDGWVDLKLPEDDSNLFAFRSADSRFWISVRIEPNDLDFKKPGFARGFAAGYPEGLRKGIGDSAKANGVDAKVEVVSSRSTSFEGLPAFEVVLSVKATAMDGRVAVRSVVTLEHVYTIKVKSIAPDPASKLLSLLDSFRFISPPAAPDKPASR